MAVEPGAPGKVRALAALALLLNAFTWGVSWWPFRQLQDQGVHPLWSTALIYCFALVCLLALRTGAWRAFGQHAGLWVLLVAAGLTNVGFNWAVAAVDALIEGGYRPGITALAQDGSVHVLSDARCIGTGERNKVQAYARTQDGTTWEVTTLPDVDTLHGGQLTWSHATLWARDFDQVRYAVTSSVAGQEMTRFTRAWAAIA